MKTYAEKLRDPRWQKLRLRIMERDAFTCRRCSSNTETLNVHHLVYDKGKAPWEYEENNLLTLCEPCHAIAEDRETLRLFRLLMATSFHPTSLQSVASSLFEVGRNEGLEPVPIGEERVKFLSALWHDLFVRLHYMWGAQAGMEACKRVSEGSGDTVAQISKIQDAVRSVAYIK